MTVSRQIGIDAACDPYAVPLTRVSRIKIKERVT